MSNIEERINKFDEVVKFRLSLDSETDRGCALMAGAYLDSELDKLLKKYLVNNDKVQTDMFDHSRPLGSFSARIDMAYLLGFLGPKAHRDLHLIRKIRNDFGHEPEPIDFDNQSIANRCRELFHDAFDIVVPPRKKFTRAALGVLAIVHSEIISIRTIEEAKDIDIDAAKERSKKILEIIEGRDDV